MFVIIIPIGEKKSQYTNGKKEFQLWSMNQWREWISNRSNVGSLCATYCIRQSIFLLSDFFFVYLIYFLNCFFYVIYRHFFFARIQLYMPKIILFKIHVKLVQSIFLKQSQDIENKLCSFYSFLAHVIDWILGYHQQLS